MNTKQIIFIVLFYVTVVGALNWGLTAAGCNLVEKLANSVGGDNSKMVENGLYYLVAACGLAAGVMYGLYLANMDNDKKQ